MRSSRASRFYLDPSGEYEEKGERKVSLGAYFPLALERANNRQLALRIATGVAGLASFYSHER